MKVEVGGRLGSKNLSKNQKKRYGKEEDEGDGVEIKEDGYLEGESPNLQFWKSPTKTLV